MSLIRKRSPSCRRTHIPTTAYILTILAILTLGVYCHPTSHPTSQTNPTSPWKDSPYGPVIGIDIGHAYSRAAIVKNQTVEMITDGRGVSNILTWGSEWSFNHQLRDEFPPGPRGTFGCPQRVLKYQELETNSILNSDPSFGWAGATNSHEPVFSQLGPTQMQLARTLDHIRTIASQNLGEPVTHAVLAVPAHTTDEDRQSIKDTADRIGLTILRIIDAPKAACFAHGLGWRVGEFNVTVVDVGAEALRVSVLNVDEGVFEMLGEGYNKTLGGDAYNERTLNWLVGVDGPAGQMRRQLDKTEMIKYAMSKSPGLIWSGKYPIKEVFETVAHDLLYDSPAFIERVLESAGVDKTYIDSLVITGGSSKIPQVQTMIESYFGQTSMVLQEGEPDEAVARGAALVGEAISMGDEHGCSMSFTMIPLGIETTGGLFHEIIPSTATLPARFSKEFQVSKYQRPGQPIQIRVLAGMRKLVRDNIPLGELELPSAEPGSDIKVTMYWNEDDSMGFAVYNSSGIIAEAGIPSENKDRIYWDMLDTMFKDSERAETVEAGGTLEAKAQVEVLQRYITTAQANLVLDRLGLEKREELEFIKETMNWIVQTESGFSLQDVDEKLGRARAVMQEGQDGLPVRYEPIAEPDL